MDLSAFFYDRPHRYLFCQKANFYPSIKTCGVFLHATLMVQGPPNRFQLMDATPIIKVDSRETTITYLTRGQREVPGRSTRSKIFKTPFFRDIENSFHEGTHIGPEPLHIFSFRNISTNIVSRDIQSFGRNGLWLAG